jgi:ferredoxin-type protein NapH
LSLKAIGDLLILTVCSGLVLAGILAILMWVKDYTRRITYLRLFVQGVSLLTFFLTVLILARWNFLVLGVVFLVTIFFGRFFCGWLCPLGFYLDLITILRKSFGVQYRTFSERVNLEMHQLRYPLAAFVLIFPLYFGALNIGTWSSFFQLQGQFKPLIVYFLGPFEPFLIPWPGAVEYAGYSLSWPYIRGIPLYFGVSLVPTLAVWALIIAILASGFFFRRFWCRFCPTGASIAVLNRFKGFRWAPLFHLNKVEAKCTKCGICKRVCPVQVTEVYDKKGGIITTSMCNVCLRCLEMCPYEGCLTFDVGNRTIIKSRNWLEPFTGE